MARMSQVADAVTRVAEATKNLDPSAQVEAQRTLALPSQTTTNVLWLIFVPSLILLAALFGVFVFVLINDADSATDPALLGQALTFVLGAVTGLFIKSPVQGAAQ